jgi:branched-chain amino acid transport system substrate-binding protein
MASLLQAAAALAQRTLAVKAATESEQRVALVIGNSAYKDSPLSNPVNDAADIAKALDEVGFKVILKRNANTREMRQAIREFGSELRRAQVGLFYFAGHGIQVKGANYLVPVGADIDNEADTEDLAIDANFALRTMEEAQVKVSIVILDACRNNPFARSFRSTARGLATMNAATGSVVAFATAPGSVAADGTGRNGIYTKHLLASLRENDSDILKVFQRTRARVVKETGGKQTPWESTSLIGDFYFRPPGAKTQGETQVATNAPTNLAAGIDPAANERTFWDSVKDSRNADELNAYLERFPNGLFATLAQARLRSLSATQIASTAPAIAATRPPQAGSIASIASGASLKEKYDPGASSTEIKIGNIRPDSGPASAYGTIGKAIGAYFKKINDEGGINGRKITYISYDDGYSPPRTVEMARKLVEQDEVLFILNSLGTPSNSAIHKYMNAKKVPQLFVATGASKWNDPANNPWTMGWQPNYQTEGTIYAQHILKNMPNAKIGVLYQNDDYGKDLLKGFKDGLGAKTGMIVKEVSYEVSTSTVDSQIVQLQSSGADTLMNITTPKFAALAIRRAYDSGWKPVHYLNNVGASPGSVLVPAGLDKSVGLISTQYLKNVSDKAWANDPAILEFTAFMKKYYPDGNLIDSSNFYGWSVAQTMVQVLKQCGDNLTRENVMKQAASLKDYVNPGALPGIRINTSATDFAPIESMQLMKFDGKQWVGFGDIMGK